MRLNLGCGSNKKPGWLNVDKLPTFQPDALVDLEKFPWPWPDNTAEEVLLNHVLEHLGALPEVYIGVMKELWRVCRDGATVTIVVPHPRSDDFIADPTHVRAITGEGLVHFSRKANEYWCQAGFSNTPLALHHGIDFDLVSTETMLQEPWASGLGAGTMDQKTVEEAALRYYNVVRQQQFVLKAVK